MKSRRSKVEANKPHEWLSILKCINQMLREFSGDSIMGNRNGQKKRISKPALSALFEAYADTLGYYVRINSGTKRISGEEAHIARLWHKVGTRLSKFDEALGGRLKAQSTSWANDDFWSKAFIQKAWPLLNEIRTNANLANQDDPETRRMMGWKAILASR